jgi:hypothetical protein
MPPPSTQGNDEAEHSVIAVERLLTGSCPLDRGEHRRRGRTVQAAVLVGSVYLRGPPQAFALHVFYGALIDPARARKPQRRRFE